MVQRNSGGNLSWASGLKALPMIAGAIAIIAAGTVPKQAMAQQVWIGSGNGWQEMRDHPEQWEYVRKNADGFYVNFIQLLKATKGDLSPLAAEFTNKNAYFESDSRNTGLGGFPDGGQFTRDLQKQELNALIDAGFNVKYASLNYGLDANKLDDLEHIGVAPGATRPVFAQCGSWDVGGDINGSTSTDVSVRAEIAETDGISSDGPMSLWESNQGLMHSGSYSLVKYVHSLKKTAVVMVSPYNLEPRTKWLAMAQTCVRQHENAKAKPDIWDVFEYATDTPTLPETDATGNPANTITGMAFWLIHHVKDPAHYAKMTVPVLAHGAQAVSYTQPNTTGYTVVIGNSSTWLDLCPVITAKIDGAGNDWKVGFSLGSKDVTSSVLSGDGLSFIGDLRLWPGMSKTLSITCTRVAHATAAAPPAITLEMRSNPSVKDQVEQSLVIKPRLTQATSTAAIQ